MQYAFGLAFILKHKYFTEASEATLKYCAGDESDHLRRDDLGVKLKDVIPSLSDEQVPYSNLL